MAVIIVGIADCQTSKNPDATLVTFALGSCVGVAMLDPSSSAGGLLTASAAGVRERPGGTSENATVSDCRNDAAHPRTRRAGSRAGIRPDVSANQFDNN